MGAKTKGLAIMFTDMKGFTTRTSLESREEIQHLLEIQDEVVRPIFGQYDGTIVKTIGDAYLVTFESPTNAVLCGVKVQETIAKHNHDANEDEKFELRIAVNFGEVNLKDDDVFGEPVNIASRIESIAEPGEVYFTEAVYLAMNKNEVPTAEIGYRYLKGIADQVKVYKVLQEEGAMDKHKSARSEKTYQHANLDKDKHNTSDRTTEEESFPGIVKLLYLALIVVVVVFAWSKLPIKTKNLIRSRVFPAPTPTVQIRRLPVNFKK